MIKVYQRQKNY